MTYSAKFSIEPAQLIIEMQFSNDARERGVAQLDS